MGCTVVQGQFLSPLEKHSQPAVFSTPAYVSLSLFYAGYLMAPQKVTPLAICGKMAVKYLPGEVLKVSKLAWGWTWFGFLLALDIAIPWYVLTNVEKMSGAFLFWTVWVVAVIISAFIILLKWRGVEE